MEHPLHKTAIFVALAIALEAPAYGQAEYKASIAIEADGIAYALPGYSAFVNLSLRNGFQFAFVDHQAVPLPIDVVLFEVGKPGHAETGNHAAARESAVRELDALTTFLRSEKISGGA
jgi:hypothetical protein